MRHEGILHRWHSPPIRIGPLGGHAVETGLVIASRDALAADVVGAKMLGFNGQAVRRLWAAERLGLGETDAEKMQFPVMNLRQAIEAFTEAAYGQRLTFESGLIQPHVKNERKASELS